MCVWGGGGQDKLYPCKKEWGGGGKMFAVLKEGTNKFHSVKKKHPGWRGGARYGLDPKFSNFVAHPLHLINYQTLTARQ